MADELRAHLELRVDALMASGIEPEEARRRARVEFGPVEAYKDRIRDTRRLTWLDDLRQDVRHAMRSFGRTPGFTAVAVLTLAVGIGANTAIFSLADAVALRAIPYADPDRLVVLWGNVMRASLERRGASFPDYLDWRQRARTFEDLAAVDSQMVTLAGVDEPERLNVEYVSSSYFPLLRASPVLGRAFRADEDRLPTPEPVVVLSDGLWKGQFGADPQIVGRSIRLGGLPDLSFTVIGVMPPGFTGITDRAEAWIPFAWWAPPSVMENRGTRGFRVLARLKPGVEMASAQREFDEISRQLTQAYPDTNDQSGVEISPLDVELVGALSSILRILLAAVGFVLLIACANIANLLIVRADARRREFAVRSAIGAGRARLVRQLVTESCVLMLLGAVVGLVLARLAVPTLLALSPVAFPTFFTPDLDVRVAAFTGLTSLVCGIAVGLVPGWRAGATTPGGALNESIWTTGSRRAHRVRGAMVVVEVSLAVMLLVGAGLLIRSIRNVAAVDPGFDSDSVLTLHASIPSLPTSSAGPSEEMPRPPRRVVESRVLLDRIRVLPGVVNVGLGNDAPLDGVGGTASFYTAEGQSPVTAENTPRAFVHRVSPDFFDTLGIQMLRGRTFSATEATVPSSAVIVSEGVADRFWSGEDPIGKRVKLGGIDSASPWLQIVGVVRDVKYRGLPDNPTVDPDVYLPFLDTNQQVALVVQTSVPPASLVDPIRATIREASRSIAIYDVALMTERVSERTAMLRFTTWLMSVFAGIALSLALIGIYGVTAAMVGQRTREIGIRMALGAERTSVLRLVLGHVVMVVGIGLAAGLAGASAVTRSVQRLLFGLTPFDLATFVMVFSAFAAVALLASYVPARRATKVDPLVALRHE